MDDRPVRQETIKLLEEKTGKNLIQHRPQQLLTRHVSRPRGIQAKMNYWDLIKTKSFCTTKETISKTKRQLTEREKTFANDISRKGLVSKIYKELTKLNTQKNK